ncbi:hypothetical protein ACOBV8_21800 (plasmid) [Pseudoalteromonas espejiana]
MGGFIAGLIIGYIFEK